MAILPIPASFTPAAAAALRSTFAALRPQQRAALSSIESAVRAGASANAIQQALAGTVAAIRRSTLLDIVRAQREAIREAGQLQFLRLNQRPDPADLPTAITTLRRDLSFTVRGSLIDQFGEEVEQFVTVASDRALPRGQIESLAANALTSGRYGEVQALQEVELVGGLRAGPGGTVFGTL